MYSSVKENKSVYSKTLGNNSFTILKYVSYFFLSKNL